jgi:predicted amidohydrolase
MIQRGNGDTLNIKIGLAQTRIEHLAVERNMGRAKETVARAAAEGCDIVAFPELFLTGPLRGHPDLAQPIPGPFTEAFSALAREYGLHIVMGTIAEQEEGRIYNTSVLLDDEGRIVGKYRKIKLWNGEKEYITPGAELPVFDTKLGRIGLSICWDLAFPELAKGLALKGAEFIFCPSYWLYGDKYGMLTSDVARDAVPKHDTETVFVETCSRARAIENELFFLYINGWGDVDLEGYRDRLIGGTQLAGPFYGTIAQAEDRQELLTAEADLGLLELAEGVYRIREDSQEL